MTLPNILLTYAAVFDYLAYESPTDVDNVTLELSPEFLESFTTFLSSHSIHLHYLAGSWSALSLPPLLPPRINLCYTAETIYNLSTLPSLINLLKFSNTESLVAAKKVYFGVGGSIFNFQTVIEREGGRIETVWESKGSVERVVLSVRFG